MGVAWKGEGVSLDWIMYASLLKENKYYWAPGIANLV